MNITLRQLQTFREVMRLNSLSEAARAIGRSQPAVSSTIANLEQELGFALFQREKGRVIPTPEAHYFLEEAQTVLDRMDRTERMMREIGTLQTGQLRIACMPAASGFFLPRVLGDFVANRPEVKATLLTRSSTLIEGLIASQQYDIGLCEPPAPRNTIRAEGYDLNCLCALHRDHPLAGRAAITAADLDGQPLATLAPDHPIRVETEQAFAAAGVAFTPRFELQLVQPALALVERQLCVAICDSFSADAFRSYQRAEPDIVFVPFRPPIAMPVAILTPAQRPLSLLARAFCDHLRRAMGALQAG